MGALHAGHLALLRRARHENDRVLVSIFVNPTQFGPHEDFKRYPRPWARDLHLLAQAGADAVFNPIAAELYPASTGGVRASVLAQPMLSQGLCGRYRPGHFDGVCTVLAKLFNVVGSCRAYFGEKDFQQLRVIEAMVSELCFPIEVRPCATVRETAGLAMSSRNAHLSTRERQAALVLWQALLGAGLLAQQGERRVAQIKKKIRQVFKSEPLLKLQYCEVCSEDDLQPLAIVPTKAPYARMFVAGFVGQTRLIDNLRLL